MVENVVGGAVEELVHVVRLLKDRGDHHILNTVFAILGHHSAVLASLFCPRQIDHLPNSTEERMISTITLQKGLWTNHADVDVRLGVEEHLARLLRVHRLHRFLDRYR